jgi:hypothetical protein
MSFCLSFHQAVLGPTGAYWLDDPSDLTCKDSTAQHLVDGPRLSCKQQVGPATDPPHGGGLASRGSGVGNKEAVV